jgi:hypothetical protein
MGFQLNLIWLKKQYNAFIFLVCVCGGGEDEGLLLIKILSFLNVRLYETIILLIFRTPSKTNLFTAMTAVLLFIS